MAASEQERQVARDLGLDDEALAIVKQSVSSPLSRLTLTSGAVEEGFDPSRFTGRVEKGKGEGELSLSLDVLSAVLPQPDAHEIVATLQPQLQPRGCQALLTAGIGHADWCRIFNLGVLAAGKQYRDKALVVFFPAQDPAPLLWARQTNGANCTVYTEHIMAKLDQWGRRCSLMILGAGWDWVDLRFASLPEDLQSFAEEIYQFCPDTIDQGIVKAPPEHLADKPAGEMSEEEMEEMMEFMEGALDEQDPSDLADYLVREKRLHLWWD